MTTVLVVYDDDFRYSPTREMVVKYFGLANMFGSFDPTSPFGVPGG